MPKGAWRLQLLSDRPLLPLEDPGSERLGSGEPPDGGVHDEGATTIVACQERTVYGGVYVPNKYLLIFRCPIVAVFYCFDWLIHTTDPAVSWPDEYSRNRTTRAELLIYMYIYIFVIWHKRKCHGDPLGSGSR